MSNMLQPGQVFAERFTVEALMAESSWSTVYRALNPQGAPVLLRLFGRRATQDATLGSRMANDLSTAHRLEHPNIAEVREIGQTPDGVPWLVSEFVQGQCLADGLRVSGPMPLEMVHHILMQVLGALSTAHQTGLLHRDLRPANIFISGQGTQAMVKVVDFGIAEPLESSDLPVDLLNLPQTIVGTPGYLAPELLRGLPASRTADLYALGITAVELLTGQLPWRGESSADILEAQLQGSPSIPPTIASMQLFQSVIQGLIESDQIQRTASADDALSDLHAAGPVTAVTSTVDTAPTTPDFQPPAGMPQPHSAQTPAASAPAPGSPGGGAPPGGLGHPGPPAGPTPAAPTHGDQSKAIPGQRPPAQSQEKKGGGLGWLILALVLLLLAGGGAALWFFVLQGSGDAEKSSAVEEEEEPRFVGDESGESAELADNATAAEPTDVESTPAESEDAGEAPPPGPDEEQAKQVSGEVLEVLNSTLTGTGALASPLGDETPALVNANSITVPEAQPIELEKAEAGDPLYGLCKEAGLLDRCFVASLEGGSVAQITETDLGLEGSALSIVERQHPFELLVVDGAIRLAVPEDYLWGQFTLQNTEGNQFLVLVYSARALTRKAIATYSRGAETRMKELRVEYDVDDKEPIPGFFPFFAELAELDGDSLPEIVAQGRQVRVYKDRRVPFSIVISADGKKQMASIDANHPRLQVYKVNAATGPVALISEGLSGCDVRATLEMWRFDASTKTPVAWFDSFALEQIQGLPERYVTAGESLRAVVVASDGTLERIELFDSPENCEAVTEGYAIRW